MYSTYLHLSYILNRRLLKLHQQEPTTLAREERQNQRRATKIQLTPQPRRGQGRKPSRQSPLPDMVEPPAPASSISPRSTQAINGRPPGPETYRDTPSGGATTGRRHPVSGELRQTRRRKTPGTPGEVRHVKTGIEDTPGTRPLSQGTSQ